ncbi:hypothetical protein HID58_091245, partial [Brassica napus]
MVTSSVMRPAAELAVRIGRELLKSSTRSSSNHHSLALGFFNWAAQQPVLAMDALFKQVKTQRILLDPSVYRSLIDALLL